MQPVLDLACWCPRGDLAGPTTIGFFRGLPRLFFGGSAAGGDGLSEASGVCCCCFEMPATASVGVQGSLLTFSPTVALLAISSSVSVEELSSKSMVNVNTDDTLEQSVGDSTGTSTVELDPSDLKLVTNAMEQDADFVDDREMPCSPEHEK